jgi:fructoselysine-6-P-deglycase FrlB-like protein
MGSFVSEEIASQPACWRRAVELGQAYPALPQPGEKAAVVGCGTSWFIGMSYAVMRESACLGITDAFAASEFPTGRDYDVIVAISRSGTTTEVDQLLRTQAGSARTVAIVGVDGTPITGSAQHSIVLDFADEQSVVQTRYATTTLALLRAQVGENLTGAIGDAETALQLPIPDAAVTAEQITFLGRGWTIGLAHEAALKTREAAQTWAEAYPAMDYRHGPIAIAAPLRVVWTFGEMPIGLDQDVTQTGADWIAFDLDPMAVLVLAQRTAVARAERAGLDPDNPRALTRSVVLNATS